MEEKLDFLKEILKNTVFVTPFCLSFWRLQVLLDYMFSGFISATVMKIKQKDKIHDSLKQFWIGVFQ